MNNPYESMFSAYKGDIVRIHRSKRDGKLISYDNKGKVILVKNQQDLHAGFGKIKSLTERDSYYFATLDQVPYDIYCKDGDEKAIPYDELKKVLESLNFTHELQLPIKDTVYGLDPDNFFDVWANLDTGDMITIETWNQNGEKSYNSIYLYIPTGNTLAFSFVGDKSGFSSGGYNTCCFNVIWCKDDTPLHTLLKYSSKSRDWDGDTPHLWHYGDGQEIDFAEVLKRAYLFKDDLGSLFNMKLEDNIRRREEFFKKTIES